MTTESGNDVIDGDLADDRPADDDGDNVARLVIDAKAYPSACGPE